MDATSGLTIGTPNTIRTLEGDVDMTVDDDLIIMIGVKGEVYPNRREKFKKSYVVTDKPYCTDEIRTQCNTAYEPTVHNRKTGEVLQLADYAKICISSGGTHIYAKELTERVKIFTAWDSEKYMLGTEGDFLAVRCDDKHDIYVVERDIFYKTYNKADAVGHGEEAWEKTE